MGDFWGMVEHVPENLSEPAGAGLVLFDGQEMIMVTHLDKQSEAIHKIYPLTPFS